MTLKQTIAIHENEKMRITVVNNIQEAISYYLENEGFLSCANKIENKVCENLKQCNDFFKKEKPKKIRNKVRPIKK